MSNSEYYKELADYHLTHYELNKKMGSPSRRNKRVGSKKSSKYGRHAEITSTERQARQNRDSRQT